MARSSPPFSARFATKGVVITMVKLLRHAAAAALFATVATDAALAGINPAPGPMIGAGAPALAVFAAGYWLIRRRKRG
jgi:hypothetical protein